VNDRLQTLRFALRLEWGELANRLDMSRSMLDFVRKGQRNLSFGALHRLEELERSAGLLNGPVPTGVAMESQGGYTTAPDRKEVNKLEAFQEIKRIRESLTKLEKLLGGGENE